MKTIPKPAGFWIRFVSRLLDLLLFFVISFSIAIPGIIGNSSKGFNSELWFYLWSTISFITMITIFIIFPWITNGKTPAMFLLRIKIIFKNKTSKFKSIFYRELFFSIVWIVNIFMIISIINYSMINDVITGNILGFSIFENFRLALFGSVSSILVLFQWIFAISVMVRLNKEGLHDKFSQTQTVWSKKFIKVKTVNNKISSFKPFMIDGLKIEWVEA